MEESLIGGIKSKIEIIIAKYEALKKENQELSAHLQDYKEQLETSKNKIRELEKKIDNLQLIEAFKNSSADTKEAKKRVSVLIKEIDKCLALLSS